MRNPFRPTARPRPGGDARRYGPDPLPQLGVGSTFDPDYLDPLRALVAVDEMSDLDNVTVGGRRWWIVVDRRLRRLA